MVSPDVHALRKSLIRLGLAGGVTSALALMMDVTDGVPVSGMTARFVCVLTESGSAQWVAIPLLGFLLILLADPMVEWRLRRFQVGKLLILLCLVLPLFALLNERVVKRALHLPRPSHQALAEAQLIPNPGLFYQLSPQERHAVLAPLHDPTAAADAAQQLQIDPAVLTHWVHEVSSSFPSGHALNAFLAATLFVLLAAERRTRVSTTVSISLLTWAMAVACSRVLLGVHRPADIIAGAALGMAFGLLVGWVFLRPQSQKRVD